jgi:prevent-host-death family protein
MPVTPEEMPISEFKATCLAVLERVRRTGRPVIITRHGKPIAEVGPLAAQSVGAPWIGRLKGTAELADDLTAPLTEQWDVLKP